MSAMSLIAILFAVAFAAYAVWVLSVAFASDDDDEVSTEEMVDDLRNSFSYSG